mgnify:CR=1 FL=1
MYKRQGQHFATGAQDVDRLHQMHQILRIVQIGCLVTDLLQRCLLYTSDAADERSSVDLGGRRIIKKKKKRREEKELHAPKQ